MLRLILACVVAMLLVTASPAFADTRQQILRECQDGALTGDYTAKEIRDARDNIPTDIDQYSNCRQVLTRALLGLAGGSSNPPLINVVIPLLRAAGMRFGLIVWTWLSTPPAVAMSP